jgi:hypothetical protein
MKFFRLIWITAALSTLFLLAGCESLGLVRSVPEEEQAPLFIAPTFIATSNPDGTTGPNQTTNQTPAVTCTDPLQWLYDLSIPDGSQVAPGSILEKQWQVKNSGTCNWDENFTLRLTAGIDLGASSPQLLVPARGGTEAVIQIQFTAPAEQGRYRSAWQAYNPSGQPFGDPIFIEIVVTAP